MPILDGHKVDADQIDSAKHSWIGTFRPPWPNVQKLEREIIGGECRCGCSFSMPYVIQYDVLQEHYNRGCFDEQQYVTIAGEISDA